MPWWQDGPAAAPRSVRLPALADALRIWKNEVNIPGRMMKHELIITCHEPSLIYYYILIYLYMYTVTIAYIWNISTIPVLILTDQGNDL